MVVKGLKSFMKENCPKACYRVRISDLVSQHRETTGNRAEIVVDADSLFWKWHRGLNGIIGTEGQVLIERIRSFLTNFENINAELVFFISGSTEMEKPGWLEQTRFHWQEIRNVYDTLSRRKSCQDILEDHVIIPPNMTDFVAYVLKYVFNCKVFASVDECKEGIIPYVAENGSLAILSDNTDFVVSDVDCVMLSVDDLDFSELVTTLYDRKKLCHKLHIKKRDLPYLAILAGTDHHDSEPLKAFLRRNNDLPKDDRISNNRLFPRLVDCMDTYKSLDELLDYIERTGGIGEPDELIDMEDFEENEITNMDEIRRVYESYFAKSRPASDSQSPKDDWSEVLSIAEARLRDMLLPVSAWNVLSQRLYKCPPFIEKYRVADIKDGDPKELSSATITRPLRQRLYGILFYERRQSNPVVIEWCRDNGNSYKKLITVQPEYIEASHPGLKALWDENQTNINRQNKWTLFLKAISNKPIQNVTAWMNLPADLVVSTAACFYLHMERAFLNESDLKTILATVAMYPAFNRDSLDSLFDGNCDLWSVKISGTFDLTFNFVFNVLASCGYPVPLNKETAYMKFEPKLFQYLYKKVKNEPGYNRLFGHDDCIERFNQMYDAIRGWDVPA